MWDVMPVQPRIQDAVRVPHKVGVSRVPRVADPAADPTVCPTADPTVFPAVFPTVCVSVRAVVDKMLKAPGSGILLAGDRVWGLCQPVVTVGGTVKKYSSALLAVPLAASMLLAGCGGDAKPDASSSSSPTSSPTTSSTPTSSPTAAGPKVEPNIPAAARAHTPAGAEAFVRYFYAELNVAWSKPEAGLISRLSATTCKTCSNFEREAAKSVAKNERVIGPSIVLENVSTSDATNPAKMTVRAIGYQPKSVVVDAKGATVQTLQRERVRTLLTVQWGAVGWRLGEIQSLA
jgi:hypothetical protein